MKRVLVLEDNEADIAYFRHVAKDLCDVDWAQTNLQAYDKLQSFYYDAVFVDQGLHGLEEGLETALFVIASKLCPRVIVLTGVLSLAVATASKAFKVHLFVEKPITRHALEKILN